MNNIISQIKNGFAIISAVAVLGSCNKLYKDATPLPVPANPAGNTLSKVLAASPNDSLYYRLVVRSGILTPVAPATATISDSTLRFTMLVPDNNAMRVAINVLSGGLVPINSPDAVFSGFISNNISVANAIGIVSYNTVPQALTTASFPTAFPNLIYPSILNPAPALSALLRLDLYPSKRGAINWVNNVPLSAADLIASNGVIHHVPAVLVPPSAYLWDRISTDPDMTFFKAAVLRADSGVAAGSAASLKAALQNIGANLTIFVPTDSAMRATLTGLIAQGLIAQGLPPATALSTAAGLAADSTVFTNPALYKAITPTLTKGIVAYHILGTRAFTVNFPSTAANFYTLIGGPPYPGVSIQASFSGASVIAATVKGAGNSSASNFLINPTPSTGKSDQNALNGVIHKIDQVLLPQ